MADKFKEPNEYEIQQMLLLALKDSGEDVDMKTFEEAQVSLPITSKHGLVLYIGNKEFHIIVKEAE